MDQCAVMGDIRYGEFDRMAMFFFSWIVIAHSRAALDRSGRTDCAGVREQAFDQGRLARSSLPDERNGADVLGVEATHCLPPKVLLLLALDIFVPVYSAHGRLQYELPRCRGAASGSSRRQLAAQWQKPYRA